MASSKTVSRTKRTDDKVGPGLTVTEDQKTPVVLREFSRSLPMALMRARKSVMRYFRASLRANGLSEQQWRVLRALSSGEPADALSLARTTFLLPPSLSRILRDLEKRGLIERRPADNDMRRSLIRIAAAGRDLIAAQAPRSEAGYAEITRQFGAERLARLQSELQALETCLAKDGGAD